MSGRDLEITGTVRGNPAASKREDFVSSLLFFCPALAAAAL
jgi:hypothetical protein